MIREICSNYTYTDNCYNREVLEKKLANIENHINDYLNYLDKEDKNEITVEEPTAIKQAIQELTELFRFE